MCETSKTTETWRNIKRISFSFLLHYKQVIISSIWVSYRLIQSVFFDVAAKSVEVLNVAVDGSVLILVVK
jgi:hypothetical protein